jgi:adenylate cyclase
MSDPDKTHYSIMFADIAGSTQLYEKIGDARAQASISDMLDLIAETIERHKGTVIKTIGDEIMCRFDEPSPAIAAASDVQTEIDLQAKISQSNLSVRIGIQHGPALLKKNDLFGDAVNVAARMAAIAKANQIITTDDVVKSLPGWQAEKARKFDLTQVKGKKEPITIYEIIWKSDNLTELQFTSQLSHASAASRLILMFQDQKIEMTPVSAPVTMGRDKSCVITFNSGLASRFHAKVSYQRGKFVLIDESTNGTYVCMPDIDNLFIRREDFPLMGSGTISCGEKVSEQQPNLIQFTCE